MSLEMVPMRVRRFRAQRASADEARWLRNLLDREAKPLGVRVELDGENGLRARWG